MSFKTERHKWHLMAAHSSLPLQRRTHCEKYVVCSCACSCTCCCSCSCCCSALPYLFLFCSFLVPCLLLCLCLWTFVLLWPCQTRIANTNENSCMIMLAVSQAREATPHAAQSMQLHHKLKTIWVTKQNLKTCSARDFTIMVCYRMTPQASSALCRSATSRIAGIYARGSNEKGTWQRSTCGIFDSDLARTKRGGIRAKRPPYQPTPCNQC